MDIPHTNVDFVFKDSLSLFKDKALDFLGITDIAPITSHLGTESVEIEVTWEFKDMAFGTQDGGGVHFEEEINLSEDDLLRFGGYNISLSRTHKREFVTVIFVKEPTKLTELKTSQLHFKPHIVQCSNFDADAILERLKDTVACGKEINELEAIYLPFFSSKKFTPTELFLKSADVIKAMQADDNRKRKILALLITLAGKIVDRARLAALAKEVTTMGNVFIEYFEERGVERNKEETARKMLAKCMDALDIIEVTGISAERLRELRESVHKESASA